MKKFILGILSIILLIPICESLSELICSWFEIFKGKNTLKVLEINEKISKFQNNNEEINTNIIGFHYDSMQEDYDQDDNEDY